MTTFGPCFPINSNFQQKNVKRNNSRSWNNLTRSWVLFISSPRPEEARKYKMQYSVLDLQHHSKPWMVFITLKYKPMMNFPMPTAHLAHSFPLPYDTWSSAKEDPSILHLQLTSSLLTGLLFSPTHSPPGKIPKSQFLTFPSVCQKQTWVPRCLWGGQHRELHRDSKTQIPSHHSLNLQLQASPSDSVPQKVTYVQNCSLQTPLSCSLRQRHFNVSLQKFPRVCGCVSAVGSALTEWILWLVW